MNTKKEIEEGNKLIAKFMSYDYTMYNKWIDDEDSVMERQIEIPLTAEDLEYHTSWDWLMPVVEKIEKDEKFATMMYVNTWDNRGRYGFSIYRELDENGSLRNVFIEIVTASKIESIWKGVIEFIRLKNLDKIPKTEKEFNDHYLYYKNRMDKLQYPDELSTIKNIRYE